MKIKNIITITIFLIFNYFFNNIIINASSTENIIINTKIKALPPTNLQAIVQKNNSDVLLYWNNDSNIYPIDYFKIYYKKHNTPIWYNLTISYSTQGVINTSALITNLETNQYYDFLIQAIGINGIESDTNDCNNNLFRCKIENFLITGTTVVEDTKQNNNQQNNNQQNNNQQNISNNSSNYGNYSYSIVSNTNQKKEDTLSNKTTTNDNLFNDKTINIISNNTALKNNFNESSNINLISTENNYINNTNTENSNKNDNNLLINSSTINNNTGNNNDFYSTNTIKINENINKNNNNCLLDSDNDGLCDDLENIYKTNINSKDTDNDGFTDFEEIFIYKTNPLDKSSNPQTENTPKITNTINDNIISNGIIILQGYSKPNTYIELFLEDNLNNKIMIGTAITDKNGIFILKTDNKIEDGKYNIIIKEKNENNEEKIYVLKEKIIINKSLKVNKPTINYIDDIEIKEDDLNKIISINNNKPIIKGNTTSNTKIIAIWKNDELIKNSVTLSNDDGYFEIKPNFELNYGTYSVIIYSITNESIQSDIIKLNISISKENITEYINNNGKILLNLIDIGLSADFNNLNNFDNIKNNVKENKIINSQYLLNNISIEENISFKEIFYIITFLTILSTIIYLKFFNFKK